MNDRVESWGIDGKLRPEVLEFAMAMELKLRKNDHKKGWRELPVEALRRLMMLEIEEYNVAREFFGFDEAMAELVDTANFAMMLRDRYKMERDRVGAQRREIEEPSDEQIRAWSHGE